MENMVTSADRSGRLLVTGATGFLGRRLVSGLADAGFIIGAVLRPGSDADLLDARATVLRHDGSTEGLYNVIRSFSPEVTIHAAAQVLAMHEASNIESLIRSNITFGTQLLDAMIRCDVRKFVNFGTIWQHFDGDHYNPATLYAATKQAFEDIALYYVEAEGMNFLTIMLPGTYGPKDRRGKIIPLLLSAQRDGAFIDLSPGWQTINLLHVDDLLCGVRVALERVSRQSAGIYESYALRGPETVRLRDLVAKIEQIGRRSISVRWGGRPYRPREVMDPWMGPLLPDWSAKIDLESGLRMIIKDG